MLKSIITDADFFGGEPKILSDISRYGSRGIILNNENMAGMILTGPNGFYKLPGGGIDLGERESDAFMRQVLEEIGYENYSAFGYCGGAQEPFQFLSYLLRLYCEDRGRVQKKPERSQVGFFHKLDEPPGRGGGYG